MSTDPTNIPTSPLPLIIITGDRPPATTPPSWTPPNSNESSSPQSSISTGVVVAIVVVVILVVLFFLCICCCCRARRARRACPDEECGSKPLSPAPIPLGQTSDAAPTKKAKAPTKKAKAPLESGQTSDAAPTEKAKAPLESGQPSDAAPTKKAKAPTKKAKAPLESGQTSDAAPTEKAKAPLESGQPSDAAPTKKAKAPTKKAKAPLESGQTSDAAPTEKAKAPLESGQTSDAAPTKKAKAPTKKAKAPLESGQTSDAAPTKKAKAPLESGQTSHAALPPPSLDNALSFGKNLMTYEELANSTNNFSKDNLLREGRFGSVYKGILHNVEIAVKKLKDGNAQGEPKFQAVVEIIERAGHKHLVSLVGHCSADSQRLLVYEFVPNKTLEFHLHEKGEQTLDWSKRMQIALGSGKGLAYLHEKRQPIIHCDIKSANILLNDNFEAKVADFGLAKIFSDLNTEVNGSLGYLDPEYVNSGKLTNKLDVFSYGVMLIEIMTGRKPIGLLDWARPFLLRFEKEINKVDSPLVDPKLSLDLNEMTQMTRMVACAAACTLKSAIDRPTMSEVVRALEGDCDLSGK